LGVARAHSQDMYSNNYFDHIDKSGKSPFDRMTAAGYAFSSAGENIATGSNSTAAQLEDLLMVDSGEPGRGHRVNLLSIFDASTPVYQEVGIGQFDGTGPNPSGFTNFQTQDFGTTQFNPPSGAFLLGV